LVAMHGRNLSEPVEGNLFAAMRASPFGTYSHMLSDNNTFNLVYGGDRLFYHTGYKVAMSAPHRQQYYKHTKSHNGILVDGQGQPYSTEAYAWIENFLSGEHLSYAVGNASRAYDSFSEGFDTGLKTFKRHLLMLGSDTLVVYDELEADRPVEWSFLLHSYQEIAINAERRTLTTDNRAGRAQALLRSSAEDVWSVTDEYEIPAENWRGLRDDQGELIEYPNNAWHFASRTEKSTSARFLAVIQVRPHRETGNYEFYEYLPLDSNSGRLGRWKLFAQLDPGKPAEIRASNQIDRAALASRGKSLRISGTEYVGESAESAKLVEWRDGRWTFQEKRPEIPIAAKTALDFLTESETGAALFVRPYEDDK